MDTLGFEPRAFRMRSGCDTTTPCALEKQRRNTTCIRSPFLLVVRPRTKRNENAETRDRTGDLQIFSLTLSQLSYRGCVLDSKPKQLRIFYALTPRIHDSLRCAVHTGRQGPRSLNGKASASDAGDCRFESCRGRFSIS